MSDINNKTYKLLNVKTNKLENIPESFVLEKLYKLTHVLPLNISKEKLLKLKQDISRIDNKIPLYDPYSDNLYLIPKSKLYDYVFNKSYRFPTEKFIKEIKQSIIDDTKKYKILKHPTQSSPDKMQIALLKRTLTKYKYIISFMDYFDLKILVDTYIKALYNIEERGKQITLYKRPSFTQKFKHIKPYYTRDEIKKMALNMNLITSDENLSNDEMRQLYIQVKENDINYHNLIQHHKHIVKNKSIGLVRYYSMQGSNIFNQYLRNETCDNKYLNNIIDSLSKLINTAPSFDKEYILYRFIKNDNFINELNIGDIFTEPGFMSTTRDPFYNQNISNIFGLVLIKIILPPKYSALCIETLSYVHSEQEIIFAPETKMKLIAKDTSCKYYHINKHLEDQIKIKYEFKITETPLFKHRKKYKCLEDKLHTVNFIKLEKLTSYTIEEKIFKFINTYTNTFKQYNAYIGDKKYLITCEDYNSINSFTHFYDIETDKGFSMYCIYKKQQIFILEIGTNEIIVNYGIKYSTLYNQNIISNEDFLTFISSIAYYFNIFTVIIYADYVSCDYSLNNINSKTMLDIRQIKIGGVFCLDIYNYLKSGIKKYKSITKDGDFETTINYELLDKLSKIVTSDILRKFTEDETYNMLYQLYDKVYKMEIDGKISYLKDFYIWLVENNCYYVSELIMQLYTPDHIKDNPFQYDYYVLKPIQYLYNRKIIKILPIKPIQNIISYSNKHSIKFKNELYNKLKQ